MKLLKCAILIVVALACLPNVAWSQTKDENGFPVLTCDNLKQCLDFVETPDCPTADDCASRPIDGHKGYFSLGKAFSKFGRSAIPRLLELLSSNDMSVQSKAANVLSASNELLPDDLIPLLRSYEMGNTWGMEAIAKLAGNDFANQVFLDLKNQPEPQQGSRIVDRAYEREEDTKELVKAFAREKPALLRPVLSCWKNDICDEKLFERISSLLISEARFNKPPSIPFAEVYVDILMRSTQEPTKRTFILSALQSGKYLGEPTQALRDQVDFFAKSQDVDVNSAAVNLLALWKDRRSIAGQLLAIKSKSGFYRAMEISRFAQMGIVAREAAPEIARYLEDNDWDSRSAAAETLGKIDAREYIPKLANSITDNDWFLSYGAVKALALLDPEDKTGKRSQIASNYWHPTVRDLAKRSLDGKLEEDSRSKLLPLPTYNYCHPHAAEEAQTDTNQDIGENLKKADAAGREYDRQLNALEDFNNAERVTNQKTIDGEEFTGTSNGEFGGALTVTMNGQENQIYDENIDAVIQTSRGLFAVTSMNHMIADFGFLLELNHKENKWTAQKLFRLTGGINQVWQKGDKLMFVGSTASMWLDENMKPHWIACGP